MKDYIFVFLVGAAVGGFVSLLVGIDIGHTTVRNQAIEAGVAEYVLMDKATGRTEFQFMKGAVLPHAVFRKDEQ